MPAMPGDGLVVTIKVSDPAHRCSVYGDIPVSSRVEQAAMIDVLRRRIGWPVSEALGERLA